MDKSIVNYLKHGERKLGFDKYLSLTDQHVINVSLPDSNYITPLHHLAFHYATSRSPDLSIKIANVMHYLMLKGADIEAVDFDGNSPFHLAILGEKLFWEANCYQKIDFNEKPADHFSHLKATSIFNKNFSSPNILFSKNSFNLTPATLFQIKNISVSVNTLVGIFPITFGCEEVVQMRLLEQFGTKSASTPNQLLVSSIKHGCPITPDPLTTHQTNQLDTNSTLLLLVTLLDSIFGINTLKRYMWLLIPKIRTFCRRLDSIFPEHLLKFGVKGVIACFKCLVFLNTQRPINFEYLPFISFYFQFLLKFHTFREVKLEHFKSFILESREKLDNHYAFANLESHLPSLFIVLFVTSWMELRPDDRIDGRNLLLTLDPKPLSKRHSQFQFSESLVSVSDIFKTKHFSTSIVSGLKVKQLRKKNSY